MVVNIFWLVVGGGKWWWMVVGDGGYILTGGGWWHSLVKHTDILFCKREIYIPKIEELIEYSFN